ncbi:DoxX family protein [Salinibius halmophilus]|uniref:DoxX family protein n=1 Tax=Salinibius halmophilus TaxID=1853216 RepID=UPI000E67015A|nr:DoxX family protein [Salinibius halmophilus]
MLIYADNRGNRVRNLSYSVLALRIFTGIALVTLGLSEKLIGSHLGAAFISKYDWNFMQLLGFEFFTDRLFILSAGVMEVVFGLILILGTVTRLNILVVAIFMITTNVTFVFQDNPEAALMELVGHLPIIATAVICVFFGSGQKLKLTSVFKRKRRVIQPRKRAVAV